MIQNNTRLPKKISEGKIYNVKFCISPNILERFVGLIGDCNSLHTDTKFARRSMYRRNIVHGILPVMFISTLKLFQDKGRRWSFCGISARFLKPVFANDKLSLTAEIVKIDEELKEVEIEFTLKRLESSVVLTAGNFLLRYSNLTTLKNTICQHKASFSNSCMVVDSLNEEDFVFEKILKGDERKFQFFISENHFYILYQILVDAFLSDYKLAISHWSTNFDIPALLSSCLFSTFVGMCIPGKYAIFIDFEAKFYKAIKLHNKYILAGKVEFKSSSSSTIAENILIHHVNDKADHYVKGRVSVKIDEPPAKMPSVQFLKGCESDLQLKDKIVLITGASRGIGETTAKLFSLYGTKVAINYFHGEEDADRVVDEIVSNGGDAIAVCADVSSRHNVDQMVKYVRDKYGAVDILINNAVNDAHPASFMELTWEDFQRSIDVIVKGAFNCCQAVIPLMLENKKGKIINVSTVFTDNPPPNQTKYIVSKNGLVALTRSLAVEFAPYNIQINMVVPSVVKTDLTKHISKIFLEEMRRDTPMKRMANPLDVAKAIIFLSSSLASFTTGQKIMVTGGNPPFL